MALNQLFRTMRDLVRGAQEPTDAEARRILGCAPLVSFEEGLTRTVESVVPDRGRRGGAGLTLGVSFAKCGKAALSSEVRSFQEACDSRHRSIPGAGITPRLHTVRASAVVPGHLRSVR
jgi:hypothetical protein